MKVIPIILLLFAVYVLVFAMTTRDFGAFFSFGLISIALAKYDTGD